MGERKYPVYYDPKKSPVYVTAPDDATEDELRMAADAYLRQNMPEQQYPPSVVQHQPAQDPETALFQDIGTGATELGRGFLQGVGNVADHAADWAVSGLNAAGNVLGGGNWGDNLMQAGGALGMATTNNLQGAVGEGREGLDTLRGIGRFGGEAVASAPLGTLNVGKASAVAQGALGGALLSDGHNAFDVGVDALTGGAVGGVFSGLLRRASEFASPAALSDELRTLISAGVRVEPGQVARSRGTRAGEKFANWTDKATSGVFVGDAITDARRQSFDDFARATINRAVEPIGLKLPAALAPGRKAVAWAGEKLSGAYEALLPKLRATGDETFLSELEEIHASARTLTETRQRQFDSTLKELGRFWDTGSSLAGDDLKAIDERLGERIRRFAQGDADQQDLGDAFQAVRDALHGLLERQNPQFAGDLQAINKGWKGLVQVERASGNGKARITPSGYSQAVKQSSDTVRRRGYARGEALNQDLSDAASSLLPSEYPDSGTTGRWMQANKSARIKGGLDLLRYRAAQAVQPTMLRQNNLAPNLAQLLQYGSRAAPILSAAGVDQLRQ